MLWFNFKVYCGMNICTVVCISILVYLDCGYKCDHNKIKLLNPTTQWSEFPGFYSKALAI